MSSRSKAIFATLLLPTFALGCGGAKASEKTDDQAKTGEPPGASAVPVLASASALPPIANTTPAPLTGPAEVKMGPLSFAPVAKSADPSVVTIYVLVEGREQSIFGRKASGKTPKGIGTGFIVQKDGVIVTNDHVIDGADEVLVQLSDERRLKARVAGRDPRTDIAVVKIDGVDDLPAIALGNSDALEVGDWVVAIGNPFGLSHTVSAGIVSAKDRGRDDVPLDPSGYYSFIQTDASINPGNSGGPLLNLKGEVVGMNSAIRGGGAQGIGFAIPINMVKQILPPLLANGRLQRSALGISIKDVRDLAAEDKAQLKIAAADKGVVVEAVDKDGPAGRAKLQPGDFITAFDGQPVDRKALLQWKASTAGVGKKVTLHIQRAGQPLDLEVTLGELKDPAKPSRRAPLPPPVAPGQDPFDLDGVY